MPKTLGNPTLKRSDSAVTRRRDDLIRMEQALSDEARGILKGMIVKCLDDDPSERPTSEMLIEALGIIFKILQSNLDYLNPFCKLQNLGVWISLKFR